MTVLQKWVGHEELQNVIEEEKGFFNAKCNNILMIIKKLGLFTLKYIFNKYINNTPTDPVAMCVLYCP